MAVKRSQSAARVLLALERIAQHQPIGVSALAKLLDDDKSAVQRAIMTLADAGWIRAASGVPTRWELTGHIFAVAHMVHGTSDLLQRAHGTLEALRNQTDETVLLAVPDVGQFIIIDVCQSKQLIRSAPYVGMIVPVRGSATTRAMLAYMDDAQQIELLGGPPDAALRAEFELTRARGYSISDGAVVPGNTNIAAPIFEADGQPVAVIIVAAPSERCPVERQHEIGALVTKASRSLSRGVPRAMRGDGSAPRPREFVQP